MFKIKMRTFFVHLRNLDWIIIGSSLLLVGIGLLSLYSSSMGRGDFTNFTKQTVFLIVGLVIMLAVSFLNYRLFKNDPYFLVFLWGLGVLALVGLLLFGPETRGVKAWYKIGGISIDPVEYMKIVLLLLMAKYFSLRHVEMYRIQHIILSAIYFGVPFALVFFQPNLGSGGLLILLWLIILLVSGLKLRHFLAIMALGVIFATLAWTFVLHDYQKSRIISFLEPELDPLGIGWSQLQSKIAIGNGGIWGTGIGKGTQTQHGFLTEPHTDFIFSAIGEEFGLVGIGTVFILFFVLLWRVFKIGIMAESNFPRLFSIGFGALLIIQFAVNIGMNIGFLPIVGLPLPFVSYGGSSLLMLFFGLGVLQSIKTR
ncbi:MAG: rod shape-determining protein RodA [Candidatus Wildermuthbacteria bacterium RIFCSPHIGHO2_02_FULL_47_12]|uniref:Rod shape-determining protein RodA n=1 Tax=Candidatus Wildermuthbacteria bacterium RIFCSPHIGHO2_02_FULL_47_12 TaxID=1802451 RepID=A0A1G2R6U4_9BACT|nr:MAG: rod shape-determining protein RodA [Candidatus Wildermuthbacteria bacterium RIFCSPHIGHO2_02_FULL_47_12]